ncbi:MAG TPA: heavy metal-binding domain-containing protein [Terriglobia bacterium]|nr:heavy metal-binding domain-containing protein [Terriglobia bacterium]
MRAIVFLAILLSVTVLWAQVQVTPNPSKDPVFFCPMDKDIRSNSPGNCSRCGMKLVAGVPDPVEFHLDLTVTPRAPRPNEKVHLKFDVHDPWKNNPVKKFNVVHEKLFHAFIVSEDLQFFLHDHPIWANDAFQYDTALPKPGMYRVLGDFYPEGATPQLITKTIFVAGSATRPTPLTRDYSRKTGENLQVELSTTPPQPVAGLNTQMRFSITPGEGLERYLGAWGHMLAVSDDLIDMMHTHPFIADGSPEMQFDVTFPRAGMYRVWVQFQRKGVVNTTHFDVPVKAK